METIATDGNTPPDIKSMRLQYYLLLEEVEIIQDMINDTKEILKEENFPNKYEVYIPKMTELYRKKKATQKQARDLDGFIMDIAMKQINQR